jgi:steroid 5-alpha reductase family enzyme
MAFKDGNTPSIGSKTTLSLFTLVGVTYALNHLMFGIPATFVHKWFLILCSFIFYIRLVISLFVFIKRKVNWFEGIAVGILYGIVVAMFAVWGSRINEAVLFWDVTGFTLFCIGSFINSVSDYQRYVWKMQRENQGRIYTGGLFRYAMHINYFGDGLMFFGFAIVTQNFMSFIPVLLIILNLILLQIPSLDAHLNNKYGTEFEEYASKTKKFIPFIY